MKRREAKRKAMFKAKRGGKEESSKNTNLEGTALVHEQLCPPLIADDSIRDSNSYSTGLGQATRRVAINLFQEEPAKTCEKKECTDCQRLRKLLFKEQCKPPVFMSECEQCERRRKAKIEDAKQSLYYRMQSGESVGLRYFLASLAAKKVKLKGKISAAAHSSSKQK